MTASVAKWSRVAAENSSSDPDINWVEGQAPSTVNDSARGMMQAIACWRDDTNGTLTTTGSGGTYVVATRTGYATFFDGMRVAFKTNHTNTAAATLTVDALASKPLRKANGKELNAFELRNGCVYEAIYTSGTDEFILAHVPYHPGTAVAWGNITVDSGGSVTLTSFYGISTVVYNAGSQFYTVTLAQSLGTTGYVVVGNHSQNGAPYIFTVGGKTATTFNFKMWNSFSTTININLIIDFVVFAPVVF